MMRKILIMLTILFMVSLVGCGTKPNQSAAPPEPGIADDTITIGAAAPLSGPVAAYSLSYTTMEAVFKKVNDEGGINGRKIKFVYYDDAYDPSKTVGVMKRLVEEDKAFLVSTFGTAPTMAVADYLAEKNIPVLPAVSGSNAVLAYKNIFEMFPSYVTGGQTMAKYAVEKSKAKKVAIWYQNDDFGKDVLEGIKAELKKNGLEPVATISYNATDVDFSTPVMKLKEANPDVVLMAPAPKPAAAFLKEAAKLGLKTQFILSFNASDMSISTMAGPGAVDNVIFSAYMKNLDDITNPKVIALKDFVAKYLPGKELNAPIQYGSLMADLTVEALKRAGKDLTRQKVIDALENMKGWNGANMVDNISYGPNQHGLGEESIYFMKVENGKFVKIK